MQFAAKIGRDHGLTCEFNHLYGKVKQGPSGLNQDPIQSRYSMYAVEGRMPTGPAEGFPITSIWSRHIFLALQLRTIRASLGQTGRPGRRSGRYLLVACPTYEATLEEDCTSLFQVSSKLFLILQKVASISPLSSSFLLHTMPYHTSHVVHHTHA